MQEQGFQGCPVFGVGLGLRSPLLEETLNAKEHLDWLEFTPENFMERGGYSRQMLKRARDQFPLVSHGVSLSLGSLDPLNPAYLDELESLFDWIKPPWFSDHLCFSSLDGQYFNDLIPLPRTRETILHVSRRIQLLQERFQIPVLIENISQYIQPPCDEMSDADFITGILEEADCGLLLDVNNVYVNSCNHNFEPLDFLSNIPLERVVQIHVAGHHIFPDETADDSLERLQWVDTHGASVIDPVWDLLRWVLARCRPCGVMLERDTGNSTFREELLPEILQIRQLWNENIKFISS